MDWLASAILLIGYVFVIRKKWYGFLLFLISNFLWLIYWLHKEEWAALILVIAFIVQDSIGIYKWKNENK